MRYLYSLLAAAVLLTGAAPAQADNVTNFKAQAAARGVGVNSNNFAPPIYEVCVPWDVPFPGAGCTSSWPRVNVTNVNSDFSPKLPELTAKWQNVPVPAGFVPAAGSDHQAVVVNYIEDRYDEFWVMRPHPDTGKWTAVWGGGESFSSMRSVDGLWVWPTTEHAYGTAASGIAQFKTTIMLKDLRKGLIDHPIAFSVSNACVHPKPPATRDPSDGLGGTDCIQYGTKLKLPATVDIDAVRSDSRWCGPSPARTNEEAVALGWDATDPNRPTCPLAPTAKMIGRAMQKWYLVATDQTTWGVAPQVTFENRTRPRVGTWQGVPDGNPYAVYMGCDGMQNSGNWNATPVASGETEGDCTTKGSWKGFPWSQVVEVP